MKIEDGKFYFISNDFMQKYGAKYNLMANKETGTKRPCYFCFKDKQNSNIIWFVPISKQYEKYKAIYDKKIEKSKKKPLNFVFGTVKDYKATFLIQNMFPTLEKYILEKYILDADNDVTISGYLQNEVIRTAERVLKLSNNGIHIAFSNLVEFKKELLSE